MNDTGNNNTSKPRPTAAPSQQQLLASLIDYLPDYIYVKDAEGRYILDNAAHRRFLGVKSMADIVGKTVFDIFPRELAERYHQDDQNILRTGNSLLNREEPVVSPTGETRWVSTTKVPLRDNADRIVGLAAIGRDITDRKKSEDALHEKHQLLRTLIDNLPDFIYVKDTQGRFLLNNTAHTRMLGAANQDAVLGRTDADFTSADLAAQYLDAERRVIETGQPLVDHEEPFTDTDGKQRWASTTKVPLRDRQGQITGLVGMSRDITDRKWAEQQLTRYATTLRERNLQMQDDLNMAAEIQQACLPQHFPTFPPHVAESDSTLRFYRCYHPTGTVGGDFFDVFRLSDCRAGVFICDVMGHGVRSALVTAMIRALIEELMPISDNPSQLMQGMNRGLTTILKQLRTPLFASAFYLIADIARGCVQYASAGHPRPLHISRRAGIVEPLRFAQSSPGPALGVFDEAEFHAHQCAIEPGDVILLFTDGLFEVTGPDGGEYGEERLLNAVRHRLNLPTQQLLDEILAEIRAFAGDRGFSDDVCILAMEQIRSCNA